MADYQGKPITVIGLGKTGLSCVEFLTAKGAKVKVMDTRLAPSGTDRLPAHVPLHTGGLHLPWLLESELIVISPGLSLKTPEIQTALSAGVEVVGDIELFCREAQAPIVAITGSNGKSTVTTLVYEMAKAAGMRAGMGGNIGIAALSLLNQPYDLYVLELSSFQLETTHSLRAVAATVLNVSEDHMDRYADLEDYRQAKLNIYRHAAHLIYNVEDLLTQIEPEKGQSAVGFGGENADLCLTMHDGKIWLTIKGERLLALDETRLAGRHNALNMLAAIGLAQAARVNLHGILTALRTFGGLDHRFQLAYQQDGIRWINDSKATNVGSTLAALNGLDVSGTLHLLLGGDGKGADFSELTPYLNRPNVICYCFGQDGAALAALSANAHLFDNMAEAIEFLRPTLKSGDMVLLSPACASLDQFKNFEQRGEEFTRLARLGG